MCRVSRSTSIRAACAAARPQQLVARGDFDQDRDVAARRHRHPDHRDPHAEHVVARIVESEPIVLAARLPAFELDDQLDPLRRARRGDAEQILDVDQAEPADLHVMPGQLRAAAEHERLGAAPQLHRVVGHQAVAADDQVERALALADAALPDHSTPSPEDVHQHAVERDARRQQIVEDPAEPRHRVAACRSRVRSSGTLVRSAISDSAGGGVEALSDEDRRDVVRIEPAQGRVAGRGVERLEVADLALTEHQHAAAAHRGVEAGQRQAGLLRVGIGDAA